MDEYIDRENYCENICHCSNEYCDRVSCPIWKAPAADVAPVVRCEDCKYYRVSALLAPNKFCFRLKHPEEDRPIGYNFAPDDFCSYGERKDGDSDAQTD